MKRATDPYVPAALLTDAHAGIGWHGLRVLLRLLIRSGGEPSVYATVGWIAEQLGAGHDSRNVRRTMERLEAAGYIRRTGVRHPDFPERSQIVLLRERWESTAEESEAEGSRLPALDRGRVAATRPEGSRLPAPPGSRLPAPYRESDRESAEQQQRASGAPQAAAAAGSKPSDLLADALGELVAESAPSVDELSSAPTRSRVAPLSPVPLPTLTEEESMAELFAPMPLEIAKAWFGWWFPTDRAGLSQPWAMRERHRTVQALAELWGRLGDEQDWRAMFRDVRRAELRSLRGMEAALARIGANRAQQRAPQAAALAAHPPERTCTVAGCTARATHRHRHSGARYCGSHAAHAAKADPSLRRALEELVDAEPAAPRAAVQPQAAVGT